jgi:hypothetical protein
MMIGCLATRLECGNIIDAVGASSGSVRVHPSANSFLIRSEESPMSPLKAGNRSWNASVAEEEGLEKSLCDECSFRGRPAGHQNGHLREREIAL